jgi:NAD-dependent deacetylase
MASSAARCAAPARRLRGACAASTMWTGDLSTATICRACGEAGAMRPDVVWFGEMPRAMERIHEALLACDLFLDAVAPRP